MNLDGTLSQDFESLQIESWTLIKTEANGVAHLFIGYSPMERCWTSTVEHKISTEFEAFPNESFGFKVSNRSFEEKTCKSSITWAASRDLLVATTTLFIIANCTYCSWTTVEVQTWSQTENFEFQILKPASSATRLRTFLGTHRHSL